MSSIRIIDVPDGEAPEDVRRAWVGLVLPLVEGIRQPRVIPVYGVRSFRWKRWIPWAFHYHTTEAFIVNVNAAITVLRKREPDAAAWWIDKHAPLVKASRPLRISLACVRTDRLKS
jgi:hypothetical protein